MTSRTISNRSRRATSRFCTITGAAPPTDEAPTSDQELACRRRPAPRASLATRLTSRRPTSSQNPRYPSSWLCWAPHPSQRKNSISPRQGGTSNRSLRLALSPKLRLRSSSRLISLRRRRRSRRSWSLRRSWRRPRRRLSQRTRLPRLKTWPRPRPPSPWSLPRKRRRSRRSRGPRRSWKHRRGHSTRLRSNLRRSSP